MRLLHHLWFLYCKSLVWNHFHLVNHHLCQRYLFYQRFIYWCFQKCKIHNFLVLNEIKLILRKFKTIFVFFDEYCDFFIVFENLHFTVVWSWCAKNKRKVIVLSKQFKLNHIHSNIFIQNIRHQHELVTFVIHAKLLQREVRFRTIQVILTSVGFDVLLNVHVLDLW